MLAFRSSTMPAFYNISPGSIYFRRFFLHFMTPEDLGIEMFCSLFLWQWSIQNSLHRYFRVCWTITSFPNYRRWIFVFQCHLTTNLERQHTKLILSSSTVAWFVYNFRLKSELNEETLLYKEPSKYELPREWQANNSSRLTTNDQQLYYTFECSPFICTHFFPIF